MGKVISLFDRKQERRGIPIPSPSPINEDQEEFSQRMARIRQSLEKINTLMADLKKSKRDET